MEKSRHFVESLSRGFNLLRIVCESEIPLSLTELSVKSGLSISTIQRLSYTLQELGAIERNLKTKKFRIGPSAISLALSISRDLELKHIARPYMEELSDQIGEVVGLGALSGNEIILIEIIKTNQLLNINMNTGAIIPPHATSTGKAILAFLPEPDVDRIFHNKKPTKFTSRTITSLRSYKRQLKDVRENGFAIAEDENAYGFGAIAAPIRDMRGDVVASVTIMVPSVRFPKEKLIKSFSKRIMKTSKKISGVLGYTAGI